MRTKWILRDGADVAQLRDDKRAGPVANHEADPTATRCGDQEATPPPNLAPQVCERNQTARIVGYRPSRSGTRREYSVRIVS
jgi:hypothetical protein